VERTERRTRKGPGMAFGKVREKGYTIRVDFII
jgi:hypothetical protein